jgi:energy-coupling factor transport system substrate-specific component
VSPAATVIVGVLALVALGLVALERGRGGPKELALVATLGAVAAAGRVIFAPVPSVQPVTVVCLVTGAALGARAGLAVGPVAALISNSFLGQGPWTPAQMALWGAAGLTGAALGPLCRNIWGLAAAAAAWGFAFGWAMNLWSLAVFGPEVSWAAFLLSSGRSLPFEVAHAAGNAVIAIAVGAALLRLLARYAARIRVSHMPPRTPPPLDIPGIALQDAPTYSQNKSC